MRGDGRRCNTVTMLDRAFPPTRFPARDYNRIEYGEWK